MPQFRNACVILGGYKKLSRTRKEAKKECKKMSFFFKRHASLNSTTDCYKQKKKIIFNTCDFYIIIQNRERQFIKFF